MVEAAPTGVVNMLQRRRPPRHECEERKDASLERLAGSSCERSALAMRAEVCALHPTAQGRGGCRGGWLPVCAKRGYKPPPS